MGVFTRTKYVGPITLEKTDLLKINRELNSIWAELEDSILKEVRERFITHNHEVKNSGYSYEILRGEDAKKSFKAGDIENYIDSHKEELVEKQLNYPLRRPSYSFSSGKQKIETTAMEELIDLNISSSFDSLEIEVFGRDAKRISVRLTSKYGRPKSYDNILTVSSEDEEWTIGTIQKLSEVFGKYKKPLSFMYEERTQGLVAVFGGVLMVYGVRIIEGRLLGVGDSAFANWLRFVTYTLTFLISAIAIGITWSNLLPRATIQDARTKRRSAALALVTAILIALVAGSLYDLIKRNP